MKKIELIKGVKASRIGFGCAPIKGSIDSKTAKYALDMALDHGVNYLDVARSYGYGEAEGFIGSVIKDKKYDLYVATKFGIVPNWKAGMLNQMKPMVRFLKRLKKNQTEQTKVDSSQPSGIANNFLDRIAPLRAADMRKSLEKSLKELKREHVDFLYVHEPHNKLDHIKELREEAEALKKEGKILAFGLAAMHSQESLHKDYLEEFDLLQFNNPLIRNDYKDFAASKGKQPSVIFSPFQGGIKTMSPPEKLNTLFRDFPNSVILCSMFNPSHIKQNIKLAESFQD